MDPSNRPSRKVLVGGAVMGAITFTAAICEKLGFTLETSAWMGLAAAITFVVQYAIPNAE